MMKIVVVVLLVGTILVLSEAQEHSGQCPVAFAGVQTQDCKEEKCKSDNDCKKNEKCCSNFCGGKICQVPDFAN